MGNNAAGPSSLGGNQTVQNPFVDNFALNRITVSIDNTFNRGTIPPFSLWAPKDPSAEPYLYMPYIPAVNISTATDASNLKVPNQWVNYLRAGDEILVLDVSELAAGNLAFIGQTSLDETAAVLGTNTCTVASVGAIDSGGAGEVAIALTDALFGVPAGGAPGTGDIIVIAGSSTTDAIKSYQAADKIVIMEQQVDFTDDGGNIIESMVYSYPGRIDQNYIEYFNSLNTVDSAPALTVATKFTNYQRFNFEIIYRG